MEEKIHFPAMGKNVTTAKPLGLASKAQLAAPIVVAVKEKPPGASSFADYKPSPGKRKQIMQMRGLEVPEEPQVHSRHVVRHVGEDYLTAAQSAERRKKQEKEINARAKQLWLAEDTQRKRFKEAQKIVREATDTEVENPTDRLKRAIEILDRGQPITKDRAMREARAQILRG